jgi:hypothetical protein
VKRLLFSLLLQCLFVGGAGQASADYIFTTLEGSSANGINDSGQIVGVYGAGGFLYSGGNYTTINVPNSPARASTSPLGINNAGQVVGYYNDGSQYSGFLLSGGNYNLFQAPGSMGYTVASGISSSGQIVGSYHDRGATNHGYLFSGSTYTTIDVPYADGTEARGINDQAQVVGTLHVPRLGISSFLLSGGSYIGVLGTAAGINNAGEIVGDYFDSNLRQHGFLLSGGIYTTLDVPGSQSTVLSGINDAGQIVGDYVDAAGAQHGFLATPVPEPGAFLLLAIGTLGLMAWASWLRFVRSASPRPVLFPSVRFRVIRHIQSPTVNSSTSLSDFQLAPSLPPLVLARANTRRHRQLNTEKVPGAADPTLPIKAVRRPEILAKNLLQKRLSPLDVSRSLTL